MLASLVLDMLRLGRLNMDQQVAVTIPAYNGSALLAETLDSILGQTLPPAENIVVDDGSPETFFHSRGGPMWHASLASADALGSSQSRFHRSQKTRKEVG